MARTFFDLGGQYAGKKVRRVAQFGRCVLYRVIFDAEEIIQRDYWLIHIENFTEEHDRPAIRHLSRFGNGWFRFRTLGSAERLFAELCSIPQYAADELKRQNRAVQARNAMRALYDSGKVQLRARKR